MRGYAVLLPNIRGATGYGRQFEYANQSAGAIATSRMSWPAWRTSSSNRTLSRPAWGSPGRATAGSCRYAPPHSPQGSFRRRSPHRATATWVHFMGEQELRHIKMTTYELGPLPAIARPVSVAVADQLDRQHPDADLSHSWRQTPRPSPDGGIAPLRRPAGDALQTVQVQDLSQRAVLRRARPISASCSATCWPFSTST